MTGLRHPLALLLLPGPTHADQSLKSKAAAVEIIAMMAPSSWVKQT
jgi:hypothetical protein